MSVKLREALSKDLLFVAMQPVVDLHGHRVFANEALLRRDAWKYLREVDEAFARLGRRASTRGI